MAWFNNKCFFKKFFRFLLIAQSDIRQRHKVIAMRLILLGVILIEDQEIR